MHSPSIETDRLRHDASHGRLGSRHSRGFTMAEIIVVLMISSMMIVLAIPRIDTTKFRADAIVGIVRTNLEMAQRQAITRQHDMVVSFDTTGEQIRTLWDSNDNGQIDPGERVSWRGLDVGILFTDPAVNGISGTIIHTPVSGPNITSLGGMPTITFHRDGSTSSDAEIYVKVAAHGPPWYRGIRITQATGRVDWYRLNASSGQWVQANQ